MALVNMYRDSQKRELLQRVLAHSVSQSVHLYPRFGHTLFFEYPLTNVYPHEERFTVDVQDAELRLVTNIVEWLHLRRHVRYVPLSRTRPAVIGRDRPCVGALGPHDPTHADVFDMETDPATGRTLVHLMLLPNETVFLPFTFLTLIPTRETMDVGDTGGEPQSKESKGTHKEEGKTREVADTRMTRTNAPRVPGRAVAPVRTAAIRIYAATYGFLASVLHVKIHPRPFAIDRVFRYEEMSNTMVKKRIDLFGCSASSSGAGGYGTPSMFVHCVEVGTENRVSVEWNNMPVTADNDASPEDMFYASPSSPSTASLSLLVRYRTAPYPGKGSFFLLIFKDAYQSELHELWQVVVQSCQRVTIQTTVGSIASVDLVAEPEDYVRAAVQYPRGMGRLHVRGGRRCRAYAVSTAYDQFRFDPASVFQITPESFAKIHFSCHCNAVGFRCVRCFSLLCGD